MKGEVTKYIENKLKNGDSEMLSLFQDMGYDMDYDVNKRRNNREQIFHNGQISQEVADDIINVANILSQYTDDNGNVLITRDEDKEKIRHDERPYIEDQYKGTDLIFIRRMKDFIDMKGLTYLYDKSKHVNMGTHKYGMANKNDDTSNLDFNTYTDKELENYVGDKDMTFFEAEFAMKQKMVNDYMQFKYGMKLDVPSISFSKGNKKLPSSTLIINFDSAVGCPAWNECIVKHACYARGNEKMRNSVYKANKNRTLMWRATKNDPEFMNLLMQFIRTYCVDFERVANELISNKLVKTRGANALMKKLSSTPFSDSFFTPEILEVMKNIRK